ncbi:MAG: redoxin domain-containing protein [Chloroflexi bacterium]|nr:redoxin domain-containing protein [Chloroflexota bacterium]
MAMLTSRWQSASSGGSARPASRSRETADGASATVSSMTLEIGQPAPPFSLRNKKREEVTLDSFPGKHLVLAFYALAFTGG